MFQRQQSGSVVCPNCGRLAGVNDERCLGCGKWKPGLWGFAPILGSLARDFGFGEIVFGGCLALFAATLLYDLDAVGMSGLFSLLSPGGESLYTFGMSGAIPVFRDGRWWTVLSAAWLHGSALHILFNMLWIRQLAPAVAEIFGPSRLVIIYTAGAAVGFGMSSVAAFLPIGPLAGALFTVGASAPLFGLFGALYLYGQRSGNRVISQQFMQYLVIWLVIGVMASFGSRNAIRIDNWAHLGGFVGGYLAARWLDPLLPEKPGHMIAALVCLVATALSVAVSVLTVI
jgi:rhomboid protease GluP